MKIEKKEITETRYIVELSQDELDILYTIVGYAESNNNQIRNQLYKMYQLMEQYDQINKYEIEGRFKVIFRSK